MFSQAAAKCTIKFQHTEHLVTPWNHSTPQIGKVWGWHALGEKGWCLAICNHIWMYWIVLEVHSWAITQTFHNKRFYSPLTCLYSDSSSGYDKRNIFKHKRPTLKLMVSFGSKREMGKKAVKYGLMLISLYQKINLRYAVWTMFSGEICVNLWKKQFYGWTLWAR